MATAGAPASEQPDEVNHAVTSYRALSTANKKKALASLKHSGDIGGLFQLNSSTRAIVWIGMMLIFILIVWKVTDLIGASFEIDISTVTVTGNNTVTTTSHPDMAAAWAVISAVVAGLVGIFVPSPIGGSSTTTTSA